MHQNAKLKTIETFDYHENKWSSFPSMLEQRENHTVISISNKMFVIGGCGYNMNCEVFDVVTRKFTYIGSWPKWTGNISPYQIVSFGYNVYIFLEDYQNGFNVHSYDVKNDSLSYKTSLNLKNTMNFCFTKIPMT